MGGKSILTRRLRNFITVAAKMMDGQMDHWLVKKSRKLIKTKKTTNMNTWVTTTTKLKKVFLALYKAFEVQNKQRLDEFRQKLKQDFDAFREIQLKKLEHQRLLFPMEENSFGGEYSSCPPFIVESNSLGGTLSTLVYPHETRAKLVEELKEELALSEELHKEAQENVQRTRKILEQKHSKFSENLPPIPLEENKAGKSLGNDKKRHLQESLEQFPGNSTWLPKDEFKLEPKEPSWSWRNKMELEDLGSKLAKPPRITFFEEPPDKKWFVSSVVQIYFCGL